MCSSTFGVYDSDPPSLPPCSHALQPFRVTVSLALIYFQDPVSNVRNGKELVRVSVVGGEDGQPLMDTLVRPSNPVVDWRTDIHGVAAEHVESVAFTHR